LGNYQYACHFADCIPEHLEPTEAERDAIGRSKVGPVVDNAAKKFLTKTGQTFVERKLFAAHLFYSPSQRHWHLFYFEQRDKAEYRNHWKHGPHIHYTSEMLMRTPLSEVWGKVQTDQAAYLKGLHVRYIDHHHRAAKQDADQK
jgi:hypothetical protein